MSEFTATIESRYIFSSGRADKWEFYEIQIIKAEDAASALIAAKEKCRRDSNRNFTYRVSAITRV